MVLTCPVLIDTHSLTIAYVPWPRVRPVLYWQGTVAIFKVGFSEVDWVVKVGLSGARGGLEFGLGSSARRELGGSEGGGGPGGAVPCGKRSAQ